MGTLELGCLSYASVLLSYDQGLMSQLSFVYNYFICRSSIFKYSWLVAGHVTKCEDGEEERC